MAASVRWTALGAGLLLGLSGCPMTDDYYIASTDLAGRPSVGGSASSTAGASAGGSYGQAAGSAAIGGDGDGEGGGSAGAADAGSGGSVAPPCVPKTERCNGHDDDCDGFIDDAACGVQGTFGCFGFTLEASKDHGYMLCWGGNKRDFDDATLTCTAQDMRLAWVESESENAGLSEKISALGGVTEVLLGATDANEEGDWAWDGGSRFWRGGVDGYAVEDAFEAWADSTPNNTNNEDCIVLYPASATWGDRTCTASYAYLCEERASDE